MADTPGRCPNDPNQKPGMQDTEDSFYDVLLWILRIALILMVILTLVNFAILSQSHVPLWEIRNISTIDSITPVSDPRGILKPVAWTPPNALRPKMNEITHFTDYTHPISLNDTTDRRFAHE